MSVKKLRIRAKQEKEVRDLLPKLRSTFDKRKKVEKLKTEIRLIESTIGKGKESPELLKKQRLQKTMEKEISIEEGYYKSRSKRLKGIRLKKDEIKDAALMLYFMWISKMDKEDLFESYFETSRTLSRTNDSLQTNLTSRELKDFPYEKEFGNIFNCQVA